jgi:hypothetical protein
MHRRTTTLTMTRPRRSQGGSDLTRAEKVTLSLMLEELATTRNQIAVLKREYDDLLKQCSIELNIAQPALKFLLDHRHPLFDGPAPTEVPPGLRKLLEDLRG